MGISLLSASILNILSAFSPGFQTLIVLRVLQDFAMAGFPAIAVTYLSEEISPSHLGRIVGIYVGGSAIGAFIGRVIVSTLTDFFSWNLALLALGVINLVCSLLFFICLPESKNFAHALAVFGYRHVSRWCFDDTLQPYPCADPRPDPVRFGVSCESQHRQRLGGNPISPASESLFFLPVPFVLLHRLQRHRLVRRAIF